VQAGGVAPGAADAALAAEMRGPDTVDGIAPAGTWGSWWQQRVQAKRAGAPWLRSPAAEVEAQPS
jgi:phthalate 4,5-dioxygenase oxygenase subunit